MILRFSIDYYDMPFNDSRINGSLSIEYDADKYMPITIDNMIYNTNNDKIKKELEEEIRNLVVAYAECKKIDKTPAITILDD